MDLMKDENGGLEGGELSHGMEFACLTHDIDGEGSDRA